MFDEDQKRRDSGEPRADDDPRQDERRGGAGRAAAAAGAGGAGLGAGAAAGIVGGDDVVDYIRDHTDEAGDAFDLDEARARLESAEDAAREASFDVFESRVAEAGADLPGEITQAAGIVGDALPPLPGAQDGGDAPADLPDPNDIAPVDGEAPEPGGPPSIGRPQEEPAGEVDSEAPGAPDFPAPPAAPDGSGAPTPPASPSPPAAESDEVIGEAPAPSGPGPAPAASEDAPPPPESGPSDDVVAESPSVDEAPAPPVVPGASEDDAPPSSSAPDSPGSSDDAPVEPPVSSEPDAPGESSAPSDPDPGSSSSSSDSSDAPAAPSGPGASPSPGGESGQSITYPYVYRWDDDGDWVDVAMQNDHGDVYYLRYHDDGTVYYQNEHGQYQQIEGHGLPKLLYVGDDGVAYFSKVQHDHTVYFSLDTYGDVEWVDSHDIPGYEPPVYEDEYEYPRVVEYEYGDEPWALIEMEDGRLIKYYDEGGAYLVDEHGNETALNGFAIPSLLYVDHDGDAYFRVFLENEGEYRYYMIDVDGGVEYVHPEDIPGYEYEEPVEDDYEAILPANAPAYFEYNGETFPNPEHDDSFHFVGNPTPNTYRFENDEGYTIIIGQQPDGSYNILWGDLEANDQWDLGVNLALDGGYEILHYHGEHYEDGEHYVPPVEEEPVYDAEYVYGLLPDNLPAEFGDGFLNPEHNGEYTYSHSRFTEPDSEISPVHFLTNSDNSYTIVVVENSNGTVSMYWYDRPVDEFGLTDLNDLEAHAFIYPSGQYNVSYYEDGVEVEAPVVEDYDGVLPPGTPDYFGDPMWANPEADERFHLVQTDTNDDGSVHHVYIADVDGDQVTDYSIDVIHYPDGRIEVTYHHPENGHEGTIEILTADDGSYAGFDQTYISDGPEGIPGDDEVAEPGAEEAIFDAIPDNLPDYFEEERFPNPEVSDDYHYHSSEGDVHYFVSEDGNSTIRVWTNPNGNVTMAWHDAPPGEINAASQELVVEIQANGDWETTYYSEPPPQEEAPEFEADGYLPDGAPDYFGDAGWVNPETDERFEMYSEDQWGDGTTVRHYKADLDGDGQSDYVVVVTERPDGTVNISYATSGHDDNINVWQAQVNVTQDAYGNYVDYELEYYAWIDDPQGAIYEPEPEAPEFEADGYLPDGAPDYFGEEIWTNPETDERFEFQFQGNPEPGTVTRTYRADLDGDGDHDYQVVVIERADGSISVDYRNMETGENEARVNVTQDASGNYGGYFELHQYVDDPQGAPPYEEPVEEPEVDYLPDWLPESFDGWPSPVQEGFEYQYTGTGDGNQNHFYSNGEYTIMVTDYGDGTGRVLIDDLSNGQGWDMGYDLHDYGQYDVMDVYAPEPEEAAPEDDYLPDWLPNDFDGWPSPTQEGFEYQYTGTGDGNQNHFYSNGQYTIMVTDYGDGTGRVLIDDLSNGQGWDTGYDLYDYGQYSMMDVYVPEEPEPEPEDEYLPDWLPHDFDGWPSPVQEGFEYQYTGTGDGNQNHFYSNGQYTIMVTDYGDGTGRVLIDDLSNGQGWDMGYDLHDYGDYTVMDTYAVVEETDSEVLASIVDGEDLDANSLIDPEEAVGGLPGQPEPIPNPAPDPVAGTVEQVDGTPEQIAQVEAEGGVVEIVEPLEFNGPEVETEAVEASVSPEEVAVETTFAEVPVPVEALAGTQVEETALSIEEDELLAPDDLDDDGTGL